MKKPEFKIGSKLLGLDHAPFIIAELSANHNGDLENAKKLMETAIDCGADAIKIQTYKPETMTIRSDNPDFHISHGLWKGRSLFDLYEAAQTPFHWQEELFSHAKAKNITLFSTPFDESAVDLLTKIGSPAYKIASFENTDLGLIKNVALRHKPLLVSTGMADREEIENIVQVAHLNGCYDLLLFHCISAYPASLSSSKLNMIKLIREEFDVLTGLSDHTIGNEASMAAISLGAVAIEKHFTLDRQKGGEDSAFSIEPLELSKLVKMAKQLWQSLRDTSWERDAEEVENRKFRRSIYFVENVKKGDQVTQHNVRKIRPGFGLPAKYFDDIIGKRVIRDGLKGDRVSWDVLE